MRVIIFPYLPGSDSSIFKGVSVFVDVIFIRFIECDCYCGGGFGYYLYEPVMIGDFIKIGDVGGEVIEKTALVTRIRAPKFEDITIPTQRFYPILLQQIFRLILNVKLTVYYSHTIVTIGFGTMEGHS